jgi:glutamate carboxypeptidase
MTITPYDYEKTRHISLESTPLSAIDIADLERYLQAELPQALAYLQEMVGTNSFTLNTAGVRTVAQQTIAAFAPLGFTAEFVPAADSRYAEHLVLTKHGRGSHTIGLVSHLDTVYTAEEEEAHDFCWREIPVDGQTRIYGPGTVDIKGGTMLMWLMLKAIQAKLPDLYETINWVLLFNSAEEAFAEDFREVCKAHLPSRRTLACLVFEGGVMLNEDYLLVVARKGMARYEITVNGRAAHAGESHQEGANALVQMAEIVQKIAGLTDYSRRLTFNVGVLQGGTVVNRVPHTAVAQVEFRTFDEEVFSEALISMRSLDGYSTVTSPADGYPCHTSVVKTLESKPWPRNTGTDSLFFIWQEVARAHGRDVWPEERGGLSDGNPLWNHIPTIDGLGPIGDNSHCSERTPDGKKEQEYIIKESFVPKALLNILALRELVMSKE